MLLVLARLLLERLALLGAVAAGTFAAAGFTELARYLLGLLTSAREWSAPKSPPPVTWAEIIKRNVPLVDRLNPQERARLDTLIRVFLDDVEVTSQCWEADYEAGYVQGYCVDEKDHFYFVDIGGGRRKLAQGRFDGQVRIVPNTERV